MQGALGGLAGHKFVAGGAGHPLERREEGRGLVDEGRVGAQIGVVVAHILSGQAVVIFGGVKIIMDHLFHHAGLGLGHLRGEPAHHAEVHDELHLVAVDEQFCRRGRGDLPRPGAQHIDLIFAHIIQVHFKAVALFHLLRRPIAAQHRVHLHRHQHPDLLHFNNSFLIGPLV